METVNLKLFLIIILLAVIAGVLINVFVKKEDRQSKEIARALSYLEAGSIPLAKELYDWEQHLFKMTTDSPASLAATYYAVIVKPSSGQEKEEFRFKKIANIDKIFDKIRSFYTTPGYYSEEGIDPIFSTKMALAIDVGFPQDLNQEIDFNWLKLNSLENENLEEDKFDPYLQRQILNIYQNLPVNQSDRREIKERIAPLYVNYYCNYNPSEVSREDYLNKKYYQISILSYLMGVHNTASPNLCLKAEDVERDRNKLGEISFLNLNDLKEVFWLYHLKRFYHLKVDLNEFFAKIEDFYSENGFKEKLSDKEPNLIGTAYGLRSVKVYFDDVKSVKNQ